VCDDPLYILPKAGTKSVPVPCGKCPSCKMRRVNEWVFRLMEEERHSVAAHFITLTYDTNHVPISDNGFMTLRKSDFQDYMKRLRKLCFAKLKYYAVGEYGTKNKRPHFHAIVFNVVDSQSFVDAWTLDGVQIGDVHIGHVTTDSIAYTMKYIDKYVPPKRFSRDDRVRQFALMSKGLGKSYVDRGKKYHRKNPTQMYVTKLSGHKVPMPRYYRNKFFSEQEQKQQIGAIEQSIIDQENRERIQHDIEYSDNQQYTYEQAKDSEKLQRHKLFYSRQKRTL